MSVLTSGAGRGRKVVWGTGARVPWGTVLLADVIGGMVVVGIVASPAAFALLPLVPGDGAGTIGGGMGDGVVGIGVLLSCDTCVDSPEAELTEADG